jgi:phosphoglycolate phosphatase
MIGDGVQAFAARALPADHQDLRDRAIELMLPYYRLHCRDHSRVYDGIPAVLARLKVRGRRLAVVTNKEQPHAEDVVAHYFDDGLFDHVVGVGPQTPIKPDPSGTLRAVRAMGLGATECVYVGDSGTDVETAANAGIPFVGVSWGFRDRDILIRRGARTVVDTPADLLKTLL